MPGEGSRVRETRRTALPRGSQPQAVLFVCFIVMGLVSGLSLASYLASHTFGLTQGPFWWCTHHSAKMDSSKKDSGKLAGYVDRSLLSPFGLS